MSHVQTRRRRYAPRQRELHLRIARPPTLPLADLEIRSIAGNCLCPGCYYVATEHSELCLRCTLDGCDHEENRHG
jgi:hypothetical protein